VLAPSDGDLAEGDGLDFVGDALVVAGGKLRRGEARAWTQKGRNSCWQMRRHWRVRSVWEALMIGGHGLSASLVDFITKPPIDGGRLFCRFDLQHHLFQQRDLVHQPVVILAG